MSAVAIEGSRVLITGGAGLVGSHIADQVIRQGAREVIVFDNFSRGTRKNLKEAMASGKVRMLEADIRDTAQVKEAMKGIDILFHQAAIRITQCAEDPRLAFEVLGAGTFYVLEAALACGVRRVIAASSASIYGLADVFPTPENYPPYNNDTLYGALKESNEAILRSFHASHGLNYIVLRYFNIYGPRMDAFGRYTEVMIRWMERIEAGEAPVIFGDGSQTMDFVFAEEVARANLLAAESGISNEVFNIASGTETSLKELAGLLLEVMGSELKPVLGPERTVNAVSRRLADTTKARDLLGFETRIDLREGLKQLVAWWRQNRKGEGARIR